MDYADAGIEAILEGLRSEDPKSAWENFLLWYSDLIYTVIKQFARDQDDAGDCFLFICEKLADKHYRRLRAFRPDGRARFFTWLRAVARNLCLDWHRARFGRRQAFRSIAKLGAVQQHIFTLIFQKSLPTEEAWKALAAAFPGILYEEFERECEKVRGLLTSRQLWLLSTATRSEESLESDQENKLVLELLDPRPDPETVAALQQTHTAVTNALARLDEGNRLLMRLRFSEGLSLQAVAELLGLKDAQTADRRIQAALELIRAEMGVVRRITGKPRSASV